MSAGILNRSKSRDYFTESSTFDGSRPERPYEWQDDALCAQVGTEMFFPEKDGSTKDAKQICAQCPVREQCLAYAIENNERFGIWGGVSERELHRMKKQRAAA